MRSAQARKSVSDLTRHKPRALFATLTLALAVASIGIFAVPALMDRAMHDEVEAGRLADLTVVTGALPAGDAELAALAGLPNVREVEPRSWVSVRVWAGARRVQGYVLGVRDFAGQRVGVVHVASGTAPARGELLTEVQNNLQGTLSAAAGDTLRLVAADGSTRRLRVSGEGRNLDGGQDVADDDVVVLYATADTAADLRGAPGYTSFSFLLDDTSRAAVGATVERVRATLRAVPGFGGFLDLPDVRAAGDWPGKEDVATFSDFFAVVTLLALLSALVLVSNTITTLVAEQTQEIGVMKAIGGRQRQIALVYLRTALLLGAAGTALGLAGGVLLANMFAGFLGDSFFAVDVPFGADAGVLAASAALGLAGPVLAALPAIRRGVRVDLREALEASGSAVGSLDSGDRLLRRIRFLPRTAQIGLRGVGRRRRRGLATAVVVALAVGNLLAILGLAVGIEDTVHAGWRDHGEDVKVTTAGASPFDARAVALMRSTPGVETVEPMFAIDALVDGQDAVAWSVRRDTMFRYHVADGRWFTAADERDRARVTVLEEGIARLAGAEVGDRVPVETSAGPVELRVVGLASNQQEGALAFFVPLDTMRELVGSARAAGVDYWVRTSSHEEAFVDRVTTRLEDTLAANGYEAATEIRYVDEADDVATYRTITTTLGLLGFVIVAISVVALVNAITMSVLERRREIGVLRCVGARARDVRRIFAAEGVVLALAGWLLGIPTGYALHRLLVWLVGELVHVEVPVTFPLRHVALALAGTLAIALVSLLPALARAVRLRPGDALRYG